METIVFGDESRHWLTFWSHVIISVGFGTLVVGLLSFPKARKAQFRDALPVVSKPVGGLLGAFIMGSLLWFLGLGNWSVFYEATLVDDDTFTVTYQVPEDTITVPCDDVDYMEVVAASERRRYSSHRGWRVVIHTTTGLKLRSGLIDGDDDANETMWQFCPDYEFERTPRE